MLIALLAISFLYYCRFRTVRRRLYPPTSIFMKSFLGFLLALLITGGLAAQAQTAPATSTMSSSSTKMSTTKVTTPATSTTTTTTRMKADGTPDMRYKNNKTMKTTTGPMKKDGTPDMRYKTNQTTTTTTKTKM